MEAKRTGKTKKSLSKINRRAAVKRASSIKNVAATKPATKSSKSVTKKSPSAKSAIGAAKATTVYRVGPGMRMTAPFQLRASGGEEITQKNFQGQVVVLYFYPKDNTPGCTLEGRDFARLYRQFRSAGAELYGVSRDSVKSHDGFSEKCGLPFALISDPDDHLGKMFDVIQMKSLYGRKFIGIERSTFVLDKTGAIVKEWRKLRVDGHAEEVLAFVKTLA